MTRHNDRGQPAKPATGMELKSSATRAAAIATALIMTSMGATACSSASGSSRGNGVYVAQESGRDVLAIDGDSVSMASAHTNHGDDCAHYNTMLDHAEQNKVALDSTGSDGHANYEDVNLGTINPEQGSVLWSAESDDHGEVVTLQFDTPLEGLVTIDGQIYVPVDSDQGKSLVAEQRTRLCG